MTTETELSNDDLLELLTLTIDTDQYGTVRYYNSEGDVHRIHGPAAKWTGETVAWFRHGVLHREDGPAFVSISGHEEWWVSGKRHRVDGPAIIYPNGAKEWYIHGKQVDPQIDGGKMSEEISNDDLLELLTLTVETTANGLIWYFNSDGKLHRTLGPAVIWPDGSEEWCRNGKLHRNDGLPAIIHKSGRREWWENGEFIREGWVFGRK